MHRMIYRTNRPAGPFFFICIAAAIAFAACPGTAKAYDWNFNIFDDPGSYRLMVSPYMGHFRPSPEHKPVWALGVERQRNDGRVAGAAYFRNSFGQPSGYVYVGQHYDGIWDTPQWTAQWTAGLLYGYVGKYKKKVPLNVNGFSPGAVLSTGWQFTKDASAELHLLGDAGVMLQLSYRLP
jgi:hypothetical protein